MTRSSQPISNEEWRRRVADADARQRQREQQEQLKKFNSEASAKAADEVRRMFRR